MPDDYQKPKNPYFADPESGTETARLMLQDRLITQGMGGVFSERTDVANMHNILDIGCGPGGWALDVAYTYPKVAIVGIDISQTMVEYARAQARTQGLDNASFKVMDIMKPLEFPDSSFDLVNSRFIAFLPKDAWPKYIQECLRILRPGGVIRLTEGEWAITTSPAYEKLYFGMFTRAMYLAGQSFSPEGRHLGITPMLGRFLRDAGFQNIEYKPHAIDLSAGTKAREGWFQNIMAFLHEIQPFLIGLGLATQEELDKLYQQALTEITSDDFCAVAYFLTVWGTKPS